MISVELVRVRPDRFPGSLFAWSDYLRVWFWRL